MNERDRAMLGVEGGSFYADSLADAVAHLERVQGYRTVVPAEDMVWEDSRQGRIKHMVNEGMCTREPCLDLYQQVLEPGNRSGKHRHFSEEVLYVLEGRGYDLHWDPTFSADVTYEWTWAEEPKRFDWTEGDFIYIPPYVVHQHFALEDTRARFLSVTARFVRALGYDGLEQLEDAPPSE